MPLLYIAESFDSEKGCLMDTLQEISIRLILWLQRLSPALDGIMNQFTFLANLEFYLIFIPFIYWAVDKRLGIRVLLVLLSIHTLSSNFKLVFHQPRPYWLGSVKELAQETSYGIPSSHAASSLAVWGYLAYHLKKTWFWILAAALILMISLSRLYLAVHFVHDIFFGWLLAAGLLWIFARYEAPLTNWSKRQGVWTTLIAGFLLSLMVIFIGELIQIWLLQITDPAEWSIFSARAREQAYSFTLSGAMFGAICGYLLMKRYASFKSDGDWMKRLGRYLVGILGMFLIYYGLDALFGLIAADESVTGYILRYLRYTMITIWVTFLAPWIFLRVGLAEHQLQEKAELNTSLAAA
jgi:membrane-associated phospholipid phosphatase